MCVNSITLPVPHLPSAVPHPNLQVWVSTARLPTVQRVPRPSLLLMFFPSLFDSLLRGTYDLSMYLSICLWSYLSSYSYQASGNEIISLASEQPIQQKRS